MRIGILAGELSGDLLGDGLMSALKERFPGARFVGIGGPAMLDNGLESLYPMDALSVMGLFEVLGRLPELVRLRRKLIAHFLADPPDVFIGIDAPDFNLGLEHALKARGIKTVHYVSPSVWAWRQGRIEKIKQAVDLMLTLFPFEAEFYERNGVAATVVGHHLADRFPLEPDTRRYRFELGLESSESVVSLLPGSRMSEVGRLAPLFLAAARILDKESGPHRYLLPAATPRIAAYLRTLIDGIDGLCVEILDGGSEAAMGASDAVLLASGTASLEAMLLKKPMVVAYRLAASTYWLVRALGLVKVSRFSLPNLLAGEELVEEFIQDAATPAALAAAVGRVLQNTGRREYLRERFTELHRDIRRDANRRAADAVANLVTA